MSIFKREIQQLVSATAAGLTLGGIAKQFPPKISSLHSPVVSFPLSFRTAREYCSMDSIPIVLLGDAAHTIHPQVHQYAS